jgi:hypothetical protein
VDRELPLARLASKNGDTGVLEGSAWLHTTFDRAGCPALLVLSETEGN